MPSRSALVLGTALTLSVTAASAVSYLPVGPQNDVPVATVAAGGWTEVWSGTYGTRDVPLAPIFDQLGEYVMLAARPAGANEYDLLAVVDSSFFVPLQTAEDETVLRNGSEWYKNGWSLGFALAGEPVNQSSADIIFGINPDQRMSWHTNIGVSGRSPGQPALEIGFGYRSGGTTSASADWERFILTADATPVPVPASLALLLGALGMLAGLRRPG